MRLTTDFLDKKRISSDTEVDRIMEELHHDNELKSVYEVIAVPVGRLNDFRSPNPRLQRFLNLIPEKPEWFEEERVKMASDFFVEYASEIMMLLGAVSLPTCYAASPGNKVLYLSEKIRKKPGKRLLDTAAFIILISEPGAFDSFGPGYKAVQQIRLIHGLARFHLINSEHWDMKWGLPANEEDMAGTNLAFSYIVLKSLINSGLRIPEHQLNAYLHLWKWVGYLMKIDTGLLTDKMEEAEKLDQWIRKRNFRKSDEGISLTRTLIEHYQEALPQGINKLAESQIKYFVGSEIAEMIGLRSAPEKDLIIRSLATFQKFRNHWFPPKNSYIRMKKDHERLKKISKTKDDV